jgi:hypothetical protein
MDDTLQGCAPLPVEEVNTHELWLSLQSEQCDCD